MTLSYIDSGERVIVGGEGWELHIRAVQEADSLSSYSCLVRDILTGQRSRSPPAQIIVSESRGSAPPRLVVRPPAEVKVLRGEPLDISCIAHGTPPPTITWYPENNGRSHHWEAIGRLGRMVTEAADDRVSGRWICKASSPLGEITAVTTITLVEPLSLTLEPPFQVVNSGSTATLNCSVRGFDGAGIEWVHEGLPVRSGSPRPPHLLHIPHFTKQEAGIYQCMVTTPKSSAQVSAEIKLGDTAPELQYTFIEQALRPGPPVSLRCSASGAPVPSFSWLLDGQQLLPSHRYSIGQYTERSGDVVSHLNISNSRAEDGGLYSCKAVNSVGDAIHTARLNIYGPPYIRFLTPIRAVAGLNITIYCPYSGYPISAVKWERQGVVLGADPRHSTDGDGGLRVSGLGPGDGGAYTCSVNSPQGEVAKRELQLIVLKPPQLAPFSFPPNVEEGSNIQATCSVMSGDQPIYFTWFKDNLPISSSLDVEQKNLEFFSILIIKKVTSFHSGTYSCVASNSASKANYSAPLVVRVAPQWIHEPQDVSTLVGNSLNIHCAAQGFPEPQISWMKSQGQSPQNYQPLDLVDLRPILLENGTLSLQSVSARDEGFYLCKANNGIGPGLSKAVYIHVNEPPRFEHGSKNVTTRRGDSVNLVCEVTGDAPLQIVWTHNMNRLDVSNYRLIVSEAKTEWGMRSQLSVRQSERQDSGLYKCQASNSFGRSELLIHLAVQERPEPPSGLEVTEVLSRAVRLQWLPPYSGLSPLESYLLQYKPMHSADWSTHSTQNITISPKVQYNKSAAKDFGQAMKEQTLVENLQPACAYVFRILAVNQIDHSSFSDTVMAKTQEEAPVEPPRNVQVQATGPGELHVTWQSSPRETWNGDLLGYTVRWEGEGVSSENEGSSSRVGGWASTQYTIQGLEKHGRYHVTVAAFNSAAHGPASPPVTATTLEGVPEAPPENILCSAMSSQSLRVSWLPPPASTLGGILQGYKLHYRPLNMMEEVEASSGSSVKRTSSLESQLHGLLPHTTYLIQLRAYTSAGEGVPSRPIQCTTHEDAPGQPDGIKASSLSSDSILVSWLPPSKPNGRIKHYTIYVREASRSGKHQSYTITANETSPRSLITTPGEMTFEVKSLREGLLYEFWISATTSFGEGKPTEIITQEPTAKGPARIVSFGGVISVGSGGAALLPCRVTGSPPPRTRWLAAGNPVTHQHGLTVSQHGDLFIPKIDGSLAKNFTCVSSNSIGEDQVKYSVRMLLPPGPPRLLLRPPPFARSLKLQIEPPAYKINSAPIHGYTLTFKHESEEWQNIELTPDTTSYIIQELRCGSPYHLFLTAHNKVGVGSPSEVITASTKGGVPKIPEESDLLETNSTVLRVILFGWEDTGCPLLELVLEYRKHRSSHWTRLQGAVDRDAVYITDLTPASWYRIKIQATNEAGSSTADYNFATTTIQGARIAAPSNFPDEGVFVEDDYSDSIIISALCAFIIICTVILAFLINNKKRQQAPSEDKSEDDNCRNCQQAYTALPHKSKSVDDSAELYEISPYATFSVGNPGVGASVGTRGRSRGIGGGVERPGGVSASTLDYTLQFRTFGHQDNEGYASTSMRQCCYNQEESSMSAAETVQVRRGRRTGKSKSVSMGGHSVVGYSDVGGGGGGGSGGGGPQHSVEGHSSDSEDSPCPPVSHHCAHRRNIPTSIYTEM